MGWIYGGICLVGIVGTYVMVFALCRMAAIGDAMMERHLQYIGEQIEEGKDKVVEG